MTRRRVTVLDGSRHVTAVVTLRYGLRDGVPRSRAEAAAILGLSAADVLHREAAAFRKMRHPSRSHVLRDYLGSDQAAVPGRVRIMGEADAPAVDRCERHGYFELATGAVLCAVCPCPVTPTSDLGRPRRHCSDACRQASYRRRRRAQKDLS